MRKILTAGLAVSALVLLSAGGPVLGQESCSFQDDGICDEPYIGTGRCPLNSDLAGCGDAILFYGSDDELLTAERLFERPPEMLRPGRNEIFARHGRSFQSADLASYFARRSWYQAMPGEPALSEIERANVLLFKAEEEAQAAGLPHASGLPRPRASFTGVYLYDDGTRHEVERIDGDERMLETYPDGGQRAHLYRNSSREMWDPMPEDGIVTVYSIWFAPPALLRQPALLAELQPVFEGRETIAGEPALRFRLTFENGPQEYWRGRVWITDDGIVLRGEIDYRTLDGDGGFDDSVSFELLDLRRQAVDPARLEPPRDLEVMFAG